MRSATSYFNSTLYWKTMARFWPLWALYGLIWAFCIPLNLLNAYLGTAHRNYGVTESWRWLTTQALNIPGMLNFGVAMAVGFGVLCAMAVFGYLYNSRSACMMHSLPLRRDGLFITQYLAGLSFMLLPHLVIALLTAAVELLALPVSWWGYGLYTLGIWLLGQSELCLFFFSFAAFCAMFTGHILALPAFYGILNALAAALHLLITTILSDFYYGYTANDFMARLALYLTPSANLAYACDWWAEMGENGTLIASGLEGWVLAAYAIAGVLLALAALYVYRSRHVESAGDVVAIPLVRPVFKYGVSFCAGVTFGMGTISFFGWTGEIALSVCVVLWAVAGYFVAEMLLKKSFRVLGSWKSAVVLAVVMGCLCLGCILDFFGVETQVPRMDQVVSISVSGDMGYPYDYASLSINTQDPAVIQRFLDLHQAIVNDRDRCNPASDGYRYGDNTIYLDLTYTLTSGRTLQRRYRSVPMFQVELEQEGSVTWTYDQLLQDRALVEQCYRFDVAESGRLVEAYVDIVRYLEDPVGLNTGYEDDYTYWEQTGTIYLDATGAELEALWQAVYQDFQEGTIGVRYLFEDEERMENTCRSDLHFSWEKLNGDGERYTQHWEITLTPNARNTLAALEKAGLGTQFELIPYGGR